MNPLNQNQINWVKEREFFFTNNVTLTKEEGVELFAIYSWVTGKNHRPTGCGRCVASAKSTVWAQYNRQQDDNKENTN